MTPPSPPPPPGDRPPSRNERDFIRVVKLATALSMGAMGGFLFSLKQVHPHIRLEITLGSAVVFLIAAVVSWLFCGVLFRWETRGGPAAAPDRQRRFAVRWLAFFLGAAALGTLAAFAYSLKDISAQARREIIIGTLLATLVIAGIALLLRKVMRFFEEHSGLEEERLRQEERDPPDNGWPR